MCCHPCECETHDGCCCRSTRRSGFVRRFQTKQERIEELEEYLRQLKREVQAVEEQLAELNR